MNEPEDRPPTSNRPAPYDDPPERPRTAPGAGGPPADVPMDDGGSVIPPSSPETPADARWQHVVDPEPVPAAAADEPAQARRQPVDRDWPEPRAPRPATRTRAAARVDDDAGDDYDDDEAYDDYEEEPVSRWVSLLATIGTALIGIVTVQVLTSLVEGLLLKSGQRVGVPDDLLHRLGYPFGGLGTTALVILVLGIVLVALPSVLGELLSETQDRVVGVALIVSIAVAVVIALGSLLAVRANLHEYSAKNVAVPTYVRVQFTNYLLGSLGAAALALFGAIAARNERSRERYG